MLSRAGSDDRLLGSLSREITRVPGARVGLCENGTGGDTPERLRRAIEENGWDSWVDLRSSTPTWVHRGEQPGDLPALESDDPPEYVLLLNADTIVQEHALDTLVEFMDSHPGLGIAGSQLLWPDGVPQATPFRFQGILSELDRGLQLGSSPGWSRGGHGPDADRGLSRGMGLGGEHHPPAVDARADRAA